MADTARTRRLATSFGGTTSFDGPHEKNIPLLRPELVRGGGEHLQQVFEPFDHAQALVFGHLFVL